MFVHARNATGRMGKILIEMASSRGDTQYFLPDDSGETTLEMKNVRDYVINYVLGYSEAPGRRQGAAPASAGQNFLHNLTKKAQFCVNFYENFLFQVF